MKLRCVIVDDEPLAGEGLAQYVEVIDYLELSAIAQNPLELDKILEKEPIDLIFLDIQMPFMTGLDFLKIRTNLPMVILTTAYPNFALEGFQFDVIDYLLKPITFNRFFKAASKAKDYQLLKLGKNISEAETPADDFFFIKCEQRYEKIQVSEILYIQALQNYITIFTAKGKYLTLLPLKTIEEYLDADRFIQVHKSYIAAIHKIETVENAEILIENHKIPLSRHFRDLVIDRVVKARLLQKNR